ncbi:MAG: NUDIX hydrolase [Anaerolineae bacterium]|nr:NUDIX hydrolase [Anaerolineae bacterium]
MGMARARNGDELVEFHPMLELPVPAGRFSVPLTFACVVVKHQDAVLYVYNVFHNEWQLPAGNLEAGETPQQAAVRELFEESGQVAPSLTYAGVVLLHLARSNQFELGALYTGTLETLQPFAANTETDRLMFWTPAQPISEYINEIGIKLAELVATPPP